MEKAKVLEAAKILNAATYTDENGEEKLLLTTKIKVVAIKEQDLAEMFMSACESIPESLEDHIPDVVCEIYNALVEEQENKDTAGAREPAPQADARSHKSRATKKPAVQEAKTAHKTKRTGNLGPGIIASIYEFISHGPVSKEEIVEKLKERFPDRDLDKMAKTVTAQVSGKKPCRMERERGVLFITDNDGKLSI